MRCPIRSGIGPRLSATWAPATGTIPVAIPRSARIPTRTIRRALPTLYDRGPLDERRFSAEARHGDHDEGSGECLGRQAAVARRALDHRDPSIAVRRACLIDCDRVTTCRTGAHGSDDDDIGTEIDDGYRRCRQHVTD